MFLVFIKLCNLTLFERNYSVKSDKKLEYFCKRWVCNCLVFGLQSCCLLPFFTAVSAVSCYNPWLWVMKPSCGVFGVL